MADGAMNRRNFMLGSAALIGLSPHMALGRAAPAAELTYPPLLDATESAAFELSAQAGETVFGAGAPSRTWGFGQAFLGPTVRVARRPTRARVRNSLDEAISTHWHGLVIPGDVDGGPHQPVRPGEVWTPELDITQPEATLWYHSHIHGKTGAQVYRGLAGMLQVSDGQDDARGLPSRYGEDDLPLILQDRRFDGRGRMEYDLAMPDRMMGFAGDAVLVNGQIGAGARVPPGIVRLRLLNGSNARIYDLALQSGRPLHLVATDAGLLPEPLALQRLVLAPGERAELLVDFAGLEADALLSGPNPNSGMMGGGMMGRGMGGGMMGRGMGRGMGSGGQGGFTILPFVVDATLRARITRLPGDLGGEFARLDPAGAERRDFSLDMGMGPAMMLGLSSHKINGRAFSMRRLDLEVKRGVMQRWRISAAMLMHPFHVHGVRFQVLSENGRPPQPHNRGWKDTVLVNGEAEILMRFDRPAPPEFSYMFHCHILEHEDGGMMGQFAVS